MWQQSMWEQSCSHYTAICNQRVYKRIRSRTHEQPHVAEHQGRTDSRLKQSKPQPQHTRGTWNRRLQPLYTEKTQGFVLRLPPNEAHATVMQPLHCLCILIMWCKVSRHPSWCIYCDVLLCDLNSHTTLHDVSSCTVMWWTISHHSSWCVLVYCDVTQTLTSPFMMYCGVLWCDVNSHTTFHEVLWWIITRRDVLWCIAIWCKRSHCPSWCIVL